MDKTNILIVDDLQENIDALVNLLQSDGLRIFTAHNAEEALDLLLDQEFALALLDVHMPRISGFELARLIRGVKKHRHLPIIFVTAHQRDQEVIFEGYDSGAVDLLFKPLDPHAVRSKVRVFMQLDRQSKQLKSQMEELERLRRDADAANLAKGRFLANMSHEIRTPLAAVLGFADVLAQGQLPEEDRQECVASIHRNGQLLLRLIDDILDFSKIEAQVLEMDMVEFSFEELLRDIESSLSLKAREKGVELKITGAEHLSGRYVSDPSRIKQILLNIIGNAIKFTSRGGVYVSVSRDNDEITARVRDTGVGLSQDQSRRLFQPFSQADTSTRRRFGGSGLGLVISRQIAKALGGDVLLEDSSPDQGSTFLVKFRADRVSSSPMPQTMIAEKPPAPVRPASNSQDLSALKDRHIVVVDDVSDNRVLIERFLKPSGARVQTLESGEEAVRLIDEKIPDLILMDIQMPGMDGYEATEKIRSLGFKNPIIALTAHAMRDDIQKCLASGCDRVLTKPINRHDLFHTLKEFLPPVHEEFST
ncbi:MAG: response regulator [Bdellovibrionaceae bacterium]|nr:response regulator [Pseudobdellovibrionaceae bacterium]